jgi:hypothetical protein
MGFHNQVAMEGEKQAAAFLQAFGVCAVPSGSGSGPDLLGDMGQTFEVKAARPSEYKSGSWGWQFCLRRDGRRGVMADFVILVCFGRKGNYPAGLFVIPASGVADLKRITIPGGCECVLGRYAGRWQGYLFI